MKILSMIILATSTFSIGSICKENFFIDEIYGWKSDIELDSVNWDPSNMTLQKNFYTYDENGHLKGNMRTTSNGNSQLSINKITSDSITWTSAQIPAVNWIKYSNSVIIDQDDDGAGTVYNDTTTFSNDSIVKVVVSRYNNGDPEKYVVTGFVSNNNYVYQNISEFRPIDNFKQTCTESDTKCSCTDEKGIKSEIVRLIIGNVLIDTFSIDGIVIEVRYFSQVSKPITVKEQTINNVVTTQTIFKTIQLKKYFNRYDLSGRRKK